MPTSNEHLALQPRIPEPARRLEFDFPGVKIGSAEYDEGPTGCTVLLFQRGWSMAIDKRGWSSGR